MSRRRRSPSKQAAVAPQRSPDADATVGARPTGVLAFVVAVLMLARYLLPAESAALGETLWIVQFWLIAAVVWLWMAARNGQSLRRFDRLDLGLALLIGGHVLSAAIVIVTEGDRRAALNMLWEWIGIGVAAVMIREAVRAKPARTRLLDLVVIAAIVLSGLGLWQHHVWYPSISAKLAEFDRLRTTAPTNPDEAVEREAALRALSRDLGPVATHGDAASNQMLRARVSASTEPIGRFALANTFAGLLLVALLLAAGRWHFERTAGRMSWRWWLSGILLIGVAYCFWLTKSRTAVVGLIAGLGMWGLLSGRRRAEGRGPRAESGGTSDAGEELSADDKSQISDLKSQISNRPSRLSALGPPPSVLRSPLSALVLLLVGLPVIAALSGGLDRQVITEAPKSMQYRLEYWTATDAMLREHPVFGVGPGNFRQAYLKHKLPGSSEEVRDPHNLVLDIWANGGLLGLVGLLWTLGVIAQQTIGGRVSSAAHGPARVETDLAPRSPRREHFVRCIAGIAALALAAFVSLMNGSSDWNDVGWLAAGWCVVSFIWPTTGSLRWTAIAASVVALLVHLMGAGGIAMPAILQTLILLAACLMVPANGVDERSAKAATFDPLPTLPWRPMVGAAVCLCLAIACAFTATLPVSTARTQVQLGRAVMSEGGQLSQAMRLFESAIESDPLAAEPWQELAIAHATDWQRLAGSDDEAFDRAVQAAEEAIQHDPLAAGGWQMLGDLWWLRFEAQKDVAAAKEAASAYQQAAVRYPHLARLQASQAQAFHAIGDAEQAQAAARHALELDAANRAAGHSDKYLPDTVRKKLQAIVGDSQG